ncbi:hypothetical protein [Thermoflexus sp.]|uniref:hypothetical protein n=1 Tax=Thermoflexus sp. TaxID=1969742 RepID=UPI003325B369
MVRRGTAMAILSLAILAALGAYAWPDASFRQGITELGSALVAYAALVGFVYFLGGHLRRVVDQKAGWPYSLVALTAALALLALSTLEGGPHGAWFNWIYRHGLLPLEASLGALLPFFMLWALWRLMRARRSVYGLLFIAGVLAALLMNTGGTSLPDRFGPLGAAVLQPLITGGVRGILLGVAVGALVLVVRALLGLERPFRGG